MHLLISLWIITIAGVFCLLQINAQNIRENVQNLGKFSENENIDLHKNLKNIKKRSLLKVFNEIQVSENENQSADLSNTDDGTRNNINGYLGIHNNKSEGIYPTGDFHGNFASPGYPKPYSIPSFENYTLTLDPTLELKLVFYVMDTRYQKDYVNVTLEYFDDKQRVVPENSSTLLLSGTFEQNLIFYARNYHQLKIEFHTSRNFSKITNSKGFFLSYNLLKLNLSNTDGLLLPGTTTIFTSKLISIPENSSSRVIVSDETIKKLKVSFCEAINTISNENETSKCDTNLVAQDIIIGLTSLENVKEPNVTLQTSMQIVHSTTMDYLKNGNIEVIYHNPYESLLMWLAVFFGTIVALVVVIVAVIRSNICGLKSKISKNLQKVNQHNNVSTAATVDNRRDVEGNGHIESSLDTCNKIAFNERNEFEAGSSGNCTCRIEIDDMRKGRF